MKRRRLPGVALRLLAAVLALAAGCTSAREHVEGGIELEGQGRYIEAANRYIEALRKEPELAEARVRLVEAGERAVTASVARADAESAAGRFELAADQYLQVDDLRVRSTAVGVDLGLPADYTTRRRSALDQALAEAIREGRVAAARGTWEAGLSRFQRAEGRYQPSAAQRAELMSARVEALVGWAAAEAERGRQRAAYERAGQVLALVETASPAAARAREIQAVALERGTRTVAPTPVAARERARTQLPAETLRELDDALEDEQWPRAPLFLKVLPGPEVRRALRRLGLTADALGERGIRRLAREVGADFVLLAEIDSAWGEERDVRTERRKARTRAGVDTAYTVRRGSARVGVRLEVTIAEPGGGDGSRADEDFTLHPTVTAEFREAVYAGDPTTLDLPRSQRDLFSERGGGRRELVARLVEELSARLAEQSFERLLRRVP